MNQRKLEYWVIPPKENSEFVAAMENILDLYQQPYDKDYPIVCMDEQPVQLINEVKIPVPETKEHPKRIDYEYKRNGTASIFMFAEALKGWRKVEVRKHRKKVDWAIEVASLLETRYSSVKKLIIVCDNLNTHTKGAFYKAFEPEKARSIIKRIEIVHTPKHGSWLNIAENELSSMTRQSLKFRIGTIEKLRNQVQAWARAINKEQREVDWQFTTDDARIKLKSLYPKI